MTTVGPAPAASPYQVAARPVPGSRRRALGLLGAMGIVPALVAFVVILLVVGMVPAVVIAAIVGGATAITFTRLATPMALRALGAAPTDEERHPRLHNLTESLCMASGLPKPALLLVDDPRPNAMSLGMSRSTAAIVVTRGLVEGFSRLEMEAVLAHELSHIRRGDPAVLTAMAIVLRPALAIAPGFSTRLATRTLSEAESCADVAAVGLTRYPPALVSALRKMGAAAPEQSRHGSTESGGGRRRSIDLLWNAPLAPEPALAVETRVEALLEL